MNAPTLTEIHKLYQQEMYSDMSSIYYTLKQVLIDMPDYERADEIKDCMRYASKWFTGLDEKEIEYLNTL